MKAIVYTKYGPPDVLQIREVAKPEPQDNQVLVKVYAASVNALDYRRFEMASILGRFMDEVLLKVINKILGADIAGRVESVGKHVTRFQPGDAVFGVSAGSMGGFAEYTCAAEHQLALKPSKVSFEAAATIPTAALTALQGLRDKGHIQLGQKVLIHGASGGVGIFAVQLAKYFGAEVTAVCSTRNVDMARALGADHVIDYTRADFAIECQRYNLIAAINGSRSIFAYRRVLSPNGIYVGLGGSMAQIFQGMLLGPLVSALGNKQMGMMLARVKQEDLAFLVGLLETGKIVPVIDQCYPLAEITKAIQYLTGEHASGKVVISVVSSSSTPIG